jgi:MFS family permease
VTRFAFTAALGGFLFGYDSAVINGAVTAIGDHYRVSASGLGFTVSSALLGAAAGAVLAGRVADRFGRLRVMWLAAALFLISALGAGLVDTLGLLIVFRVIGGVGVGMASVIAPAYIAEIAPARIRGRLGSVQQLAIVLGIFVALLVDYVLATAAGGLRTSTCARPGGMAMDVPGHGSAGPALRRTGADDPRVASSRFRSTPESP